MTATRLCRGTFRPCVSVLSLPHGRLPSQLPRPAVPTAWFVPSHGLPVVGSRWPAVILALDRRYGRGWPPASSGTSAMYEILTIAPVVGEPGLIAYECLRCGYVTSVLLEPISRDQQE